MGRYLVASPLLVENGRHTVLYSQPRVSGLHGAYLPMNSTLNSYQAFAGGDLPGDRGTCRGLSEWYGGLDHTCFILVFQRTTKEPG